ncbi:uncharacterized protein LOC103169037 [Ornithorhynchus anatinus]|uniref:uncharacterized protein LOC103169037 n=1 Tax=Ornithorhynchus anatinus TaxID=9258 RepID=UPI0019D48B71|nr:uncharacterized protein LOC103169037 [Ornithorhynchus anatinus]
MAAGCPARRNSAPEAWLPRLQASFVSSSPYTPARETPAPAAACLPGFGIPPQSRHPTLGKKPPQGSAPCRTLGPESSWGSGCFDGWTARPPGEEHRTVTLTICSSQCDMKSSNLLLLAMVLSFRVLVSWGAVEQAKESECATNAVLCNDPCRGDESCPSGQKCCNTGCERTCSSPKPTGVEVP